MCIWKVGNIKENFSVLTFHELHCRIPCICNKNKNVCECVCGELFSKLKDSPSPSLSLKDDPWQWNMAGRAESLGSVKYWKLLHIWAEDWKGWVGGMLVEGWTAGRSLDRILHFGRDCSETDYLRVCHLQNYILGCPHKWNVHILCLFH